MQIQKCFGQKMWNKLNESASGVTECMQRYGTTKRWRQCRTQMRLMQHTFDVCPHQCLFIWERFVEVHLLCVLARSHKQIVRYAHSCVRSMYLENLFYAASNLCYGRELRLLERKLYAYTLLDNEVNTVTACIYTHNRITRARARTLIVISKSKMDKYAHLSGDDR